MTQQGGGAGGPKPITAGGLQQAVGALAGAIEDAGNAVDVVDKEKLKNGIKQLAKWARSLEEGLNEADRSLVIMPAPSSPWPPGPVPYFAPDCRAPDWSASGS